MPASSDIIQRLVNAPDHPEANQQADIRQLLFDPEFALDPSESPVLEVATPSGGRIDIQVGATVIEVKRRIAPSQVPQWEAQLSDYLVDRESQTGERWSGILTDGREWRLYSTVGDGISLVGSPFTAQASNPDALLHWLSVVLATRKGISPTPDEIKLRLGAESTSFSEALIALEDLYLANQNNPSVAIKHDLWARLLADSFGSGFSDFRERARLFVRHTYLVTVAEVIAHLMLGYPAHGSARELLSGRVFRELDIHGVVEEDFFDWVAEVDGGIPFVESLVRRISQFDFTNPQHDILKILYETVIDRDTRQRLGEYYTPDWLAKEIVEATITDPLRTRVLDPACGSGTFLFWAVRRFLETADSDGISIPQALNDLPRFVSGMDLHPVAVTLARVTYLLAVGTTRLAEREGAFTVPVYLADSMTWRQPDRLHTAGAIVISTAAGTEESGAMPLWHDDIVLDDRLLLADPARFDSLISELAERASTSQQIGNVLRRYVVPPDLHDQVQAVFQRFRDLHSDGRDHVWGYFVRNLARPRAFEADPVDCLVGNPPWLSYRKMVEPVKSRFREESQELGLWAGGRSATQQDLSAYFLVKTIGRFLKPSGRFGFVMPSAVLNQRQYAGFRSGEWGGIRARFEESWRLVHVKSDPPFFPVPSSVVFGTRSDDARRMPTEIQDWRGRLPAGVNHGTEVSRSVLGTQPGRVKLPTDRDHPYRDAFRNGATLYPRNLVYVEERDAGPLGVPQGRVAVRSWLSTQAKSPWKDLDPVEGVVEKIYLRPAYLGEDVLPYRVTSPRRAVIPWNGRTLIDHTHDDVSPGLADWWRRADELWRQHASSGRSSDTETLLGNVDYLGKLTDQFPTSELRVVYTKAGNTLTAGLVTDPEAVIDHKLYWAHVADMREALYLLAILNSPSFHEEIVGFQPVGLFGPRDFDKYVFEVPWPTFDTSDAFHIEIADLASEAQRAVDEIRLDEDLHFTRQRRIVRQELTDTGIERQIDEAVLELLTGA